jgi:hypothetical protein
MRIFVVLALFALYFSSVSANPGQPEEDIKTVSTIFSTLCSAERVENIAGLTGTFEVVQGTTIISIKSLFPYSLQLRLDGTNGSTIRVESGNNFYELHGEFEEVVLVFGAEETRLRENYNNPFELPRVRK